MLGLILVPMSVTNWLALLFATPVVWWAGWIFISGAYSALRHRTVDISVLIAMGILAAWSFSVLITVLGMGENFYKAGAMLVMFVLFGHWMELKSRRGTTGALRTLFDLVPPTATVIRAGQEVEVPTAEIVVGDLIRLRPGEMVPVDGVVREGETTIDESMVTGGSVPADRVPGDPVVGGSINRAGSVVVEATKVGSDTVPAIAGKGARAQIEGHAVLVGNPRPLAEAAVATANPEGLAAQLAASGKTAMYVAVDGQPAGVVAVADLIRPSARRLISALKASGLEAVMMTGDN